MANISKKTHARLSILFFLTPAFAIYTLVLLYPIVKTLILSLYTEGGNFAGLQNFRTLFFHPIWAEQFWNALKNNIIFFLIHILIQTPIGIMIAALISVKGLRFVGFYRTAIFVPTVLSFVIVGFVWRLILSPILHITQDFMDFFWLGAYFKPWLGREESALITISLISVWQFIGMAMILIYAGIMRIPQEILDAAEIDRITGLQAFFKIKLPLIWPSIGILSILTFIGCFNAFDLIYTTQGALGGPDFSTDVLGTFFYRSFFGFQLQSGSSHMGATVATSMLFIILIGVGLYLWSVRKRLRYYQF